MAKITLVVSPELEEVVENVYRSPVMDCSFGEIAMVAGVLRLPLKTPSGAALVCTKVSLNSDHKIQARTTDGVVAADGSDIDIEEWLA